ncbi:MAG: sulfite exporter TauE/SafE family protein [Gemmatimonadota bacterium]
MLRPGPLCADRVFLFGIGELMDWEASFVGLLVGTLIGTTGMGAGSLLAPLLVLWFGVPPLQAIGSDLVYSAVTKSVGGLAHIRLGTVDFTAVGWMAGASVPATILAVWSLVKFGALAPGLDHLLLQFLGIAVMVAGVALLLRSALTRGPAARQRPHCGWLLGAGGALLGGIVGVTAAGSGTLGTAFLSVATRLDARRVVGTVIVHAMILTLAGALMHIAFGTVRLALTGSLLLGSIPGVVLGSRLTSRVPEATLRAILATLLITLGINVLLRGAA